LNKLRGVAIPIGYTAGVWGARTHDALGSLSPRKGLFQVKYDS
jgi:hypothetical protein